MDQLLFQSPRLGSARRLVWTQLRHVQFTDGLASLLDQCSRANALESGVLAVLPYLLKWLCIFGQAYVAAYLIRKEVITQTTSRRLFNTIASIFSGVFLVAVTGVKCNITLIIVLICLAGFFTGFYFSGVLNPNILDLSPRHAGAFFGVCNTIANLSGFIAPQVTGALINGVEFTIDGWAPVWIVACVISIVSGVFYALVARADEQQWSIESMTVKEQLRYEWRQFSGYFSKQ